MFPNENNKNERKENNLKQGKLNFNKNSSKEIVLEKRHISIKLFTAEKNKSLHRFDF